MQLTPFSVFLVLSMVKYGFADSTKIFTLDCTDSPMSCNNDCYAIYVANKPSTLKYTKSSSHKRTESGCTQTSNSKSVCGDAGIAKYAKSGNTCDEYPYLSVPEGGAGAILRCVPSSDNSKEGSKLSGFFAKKDGGCGGQACTFKLMMKSDTISKSPYCKNKGGKNDGYEFEKKNGAYTNAKMRRDGNFSDYEYVQHVPDPAHFIAPENRREFLLSDGDKAILLTTDMTESWVNQTVATANGTAVIVKELFGLDKSEDFQPQFA